MATLALLYFLAYSIDNNANSNNDLKVVYQSCKGEKYIAVLTHLYQDAYYKVEEVLANGNTGVMIWDFGTDSHYLFMKMKEGETFFKYPGSLSQAIEKVYRNENYEIENFAKDTLNICGYFCQKAIIHDKGRNKKIEVFLTSELRGYKHSLNHNYPDLAGFPLMIQEEGKLVTAIEISKNPTRENIFPDDIKMQPADEIENSSLRQSNHSFLELLKIIKNADK